MKKVFIVFVVISLLLTVTACVKSSTDTPKNTSTTIAEGSIVDYSTSTENISQTDVGTFYDSLIIETSPATLTDDPVVDIPPTASVLSHDVAIPGEYDGDIKIILNGTELDTYTMHYRATEEYAVLPVSAFLMSIGAEYADSPLNDYGKQCYSFMGNRYMMVPDMHLFMLEDDYIDLIKELDEEGKSLSKGVAADCGLLPKNECEVTLDMNGTVLEWAEIIMDNRTLMNALRESGVDIEIDYDYFSKTLTVSLA